MGSSGLGVVACSCNPATRRQVLWDGLRNGFLSAIGSCRSSVRTKMCINMALFRELERIRLSKERRTGPGAKPSSQESPCVLVVGDSHICISLRGVFFGTPGTYPPVGNFLEPRI